jgi:hypothetical protein
MHKIILQFNLLKKTMDFWIKKIMDYISNYHFFVDYDMVHWLMGYVLGIWNE